MLDTTVLAPRGIAIPPGRYRVGMPQLALNGLSESWLLAECGDRHWQLLARAGGTPIAQLRDVRGRRVYPAFRSVRLRNAELDLVAENDTLEIASTLGRVSRTQFYSKHMVSTGHGLRAVVEMLSVFVARETAGVNASAVRSAVTGFDAVAHCDEGLRFAAHNCASVQARRNNDSRNGRLRDSYAPVPMRPCPSVHFNGAGFLYFARFHELVDQAEWAWFGSRAVPGIATERQIQYHGNADVGAMLIVELCQMEQGASFAECHARLVHADDRKVIADITTRRRVEQYPGALCAPP